MASNFIAGQDVHFDYVSGAQAETNSSKGHGKKNKRGKNVKMQAKLNRPGDDYPTSRVIRQDANGNVIVSELPDETGEKNAEKPRHMHCCRCGRCLTDSEYEEEEGQGHHEHVSSEKIAECDYEYEDGEESEYGDEYDDKEHCRAPNRSKNYTHSHKHSRSQSHSRNHRHSYNHESDYHHQHAADGQDNGLEDGYLENEYTPGSSDEGEYDDEDEEEEEDDDYLGLDEETDGEYEENDGNYHYRSHGKVHLSAHQSQNAKRYMEISLNRQRILIARCLMCPRPGNYLWRVKLSSQDKRGLRRFWMEASEEKRREIASVSTEEVMKMARDDHEFNCNCRLCGNRRIILERELRKLYCRHRQLCGLDQRNLDSFQVNARIIDQFLHVPADFRVAQDGLMPDEKKEEEGEESFGEVISVAEDILRNQGHNFIRTVEQFEKEPEEMPKPKNDKKARDFFESFMKMQLDITKTQERRQNALDNNAKESQSQQKSNKQATQNKDGEPGDYYEDQLEDEVENRSGDAVDVDVDVDLDVDEEREGEEEGEIEGEEEEEIENDEYLDDDEDEGDDYDDEDAGPNQVKFRMGKLEKRLMETANLLQMMTAKLLVNRLMAAYKYKVAEDNRNELLKELEDEEKRKKEKEEKEKKRKEKQKEKKRLQQQAREQEKKRREAEKLEKEKKEREEQIRKAEEGRKRKEAERKKKREEERLKKKKEKERKEKEKKKREEKKKRLEEAKRKKQEEEKKKQEEQQRELAEKKRLEDEARVKAEAEAKEEEKRKAEEEEARQREKKRGEEEEKAKAIANSQASTANEKPVAPRLESVHNPLLQPNINAESAFPTGQSGANDNPLPATVNPGSFGPIGTLGNPAISGSPAWNLTNGKLTGSPFAMNSNANPTPSFSADSLARNSLLGTNMTNSPVGGVDMLSQYMASTTLNNVVGDNNYLGTHVSSTNPLLSSSFFTTTSSTTGRADIWGSTPSNSRISTSRKSSIWGNSNPQLAHTNVTNPNKAPGLAATTSDKLEFPGLSSNVIGPGSLMSNWRSGNDPAMNNGLRSPLVESPLVGASKMSVQDAQRIQIEILKAAPHLPAEKNGFYSIPLLYHYSRSLLSSLLPNLSFDQFISALSIPLETVVGVSFQVAKDDLGNLTFVKLIPNSPADINKQEIPVRQSQQLGTMPPGLNGQSSLSMNQIGGLGSSIGAGNDLNKPLGFGTPAFAGSSMSQSTNFPNTWSSSLN